jgi:hypothetical protein
VQIISVSTGNGRRQQTKIDSFAVRELLMIFSMHPKPHLQTNAGSIFRIMGDDRREYVLPAAGGLSYAVSVKKKCRSEFSSEDFYFDAPRLPVLLTLFLLFLLPMKRDLYLRYGDVKIIPIGAKSARKTFAAVARRLRKSGTPLDGHVFQKFPELLRGWPQDHSMTESNVANHPKQCAIVLHIYYEDTWPQIAHLLKRQDVQFDLIVTLAPEKSILAHEILRSFPNAQIHLTENRGRDVRPFLELLERGHLDQYSYVCKIHGKKSFDGGREALLGAIWRNRMLFDLIGAPGAAEAHCARLAANPGIGMIGPQSYRYPSELCSVERSWGENRQHVLQLAKMMGHPAENFELDFFCGTMFWVRPEALNPLRTLELSKHFEPECGRTDGALEHTVERLFATSVKIHGQKVEGVNGEHLSFPG